ncbi:MAG: SelA-like pyridoxal phosphate-dependent enzyme [Pseudomonadales bacterium]|nr:SelA-like pyridoxal phosphate-dependent enzyme [Pseudomonadales bacterium]
MSPFENLGLRRVINASGKMTALGGSAQSESVAQTLQQAASQHVEMAELRRVAGEHIAKRCGAEAASVTSGAAAGIAIGTAAMICREKPELTLEIPNPGTSKREILLAASHNVNFGARVEQMIRLGGGIPVLVPDREIAANPAQFINAKTAGLLYVQSHHTRGRELSLAGLIQVSRAHNLPLLVDAAAEEDLGVYIEMGATLVTYSGGKAMAGPTIGFLAGVADLIERCEQQNRGIARAMKVGKEQIAAFLMALADYPTENSESDMQSLYAELLQLFANGPVRVEWVADRAGRPINRVGLRCDDANWLVRLNDFLAQGDPAIFARAHEVQAGLLLLDGRELKEGDVALIVEKISRYQRRSE